MKTVRNELDEREQELVSYLIKDCKTTGEIQTKLKRLFAGTIERMLEGEMDVHLGYEKNAIEGNNSGNSRNGYSRKRIISDYGECEIAVPRDRNGEFKPQIIEKRQTRTSEIEDKILAMYAKGMSQRDIEETIREIYGAVNLEDAEFAKEEFREKWNKKYPNILKSWDRNWTELTTFFDFPPEIRKIIYTTNTIEGYHRMVRKFTKSKAVFPTDDSIRKALYLCISNISKKWTQPVRDWKLAYAQFSLLFEDRFLA